MRKHLIRGSNDISANTATDGYPKAIPIRRIAGLSDRGEYIKGKGVVQQAKKNKEFLERYVTDTRRYAVCSEINARTGRYAGTHGGFSIAL